VPRAELIFCETLLSTYEDGDLALWYCDNFGAIPPGLKYGYADFDIVANDSTSGGFNYAQSRSSIVIGMPVHRFWWNPISDKPASTLYNLYGKGTVSATDNSDWMVPSLTPWAPTCDNQNFQTIGISTNLMSAPGGSGSSHWSDNHRIVLGPLSVSPKPEGASSSQLSIPDYLYWGWVLQYPSGSCSPGHMNQSLINVGFGLNSSDYYGWVDTDLDGVFDIQKDIEGITGEFPRDFYWLGFDSNRRNVQWSRLVDSNHLRLDPSVGISNLHATPSNGSQTWIPVASRTNLSLTSGTYVAFYEVLSAHNVVGPELRVCVGGQCSNTYAAIGTWLRQRAEFSVSAGAQLTISVQDGADIEVRNLVLQKYLTPFDFDTDDQRRAWDGRTVGERGLFWPDGVGTSSTSANFAGVITRDVTYALGNDWSLRTHYTGMRPYQTYRVCYVSRDSARDPQTLTNGWVGVRVVNNASSQELVRSWAQVPRGSDWTSHCSADFYTTSIDMDLQFGIYQAGSGSVIIDNVYVEER